MYKYIHENATVSYPKKAIHSGHLPRRISIALPAILHLQPALEINSPKTSLEGRRGRGEGQWTRSYPLQVRDEWFPMPTRMQSYAHSVENRPAFKSLAVPCHSPGVWCLSGQSLGRSPTRAVLPPGHEDEQEAGKDGRDGV